MKNQKLMEFEELRKFEEATQHAEGYEPHMRFVIQHSFYLDENALLSLMPRLLIGYFCLELDTVGKFDGRLCFYRCLLQIKYNMFPTLLWSKQQYEVTGRALQYVFEKTLEQKIFDESLFCFLLVFLHDMTSCVDHVFSITDTNVADQIKNFFENDILFWKANGHFTPQTLILSIMDASGVILRKSKYSREEEILRDKILVKKKDILWQYLSEEQILSYILGSPKKTDKGED